MNESLNTWPGVKQPRPPGEHHKPQHPQDEGRGPTRAETPGAYPGEDKRHDAKIGRKHQALRRGPVRANKGQDLGAAPHPQRPAELRRPAGQPPSEPPAISRVAGGLNTLGPR